MYNHARTALVSFKDSLVHGQEVKLCNGRVLPIWKLHELWSDDVDCVLCFDETKNFDHWKGMVKISINEIDTVLPVKP